MDGKKQNYRIFWEKTIYQGAKILRIFTNTPIAEIPAQIAGYPVTELGNYCFAPACRLPNEFMVTESGETETMACTSQESAAHPANGANAKANLANPIEAITELCGSYLEFALLPSSLEKIGDYAFYGCRNLSGIKFAGILKEIGSDAFMNCHNLHQLFLTCAPTEKTGLRQILAQIPWDVEVSFLGNGHSGLKGQKAVIFYPEYFEAYDEIAPAHIFGRKIVGEGFRARQGFQDGILDFPQYDRIFKKACAEESVQTLCRLAFDRLRYPIGLSDAGKLQYGDYILAHGKELCQWLISGRQLDSLLFLFQERLLPQPDMQHALSLAAQEGWSEGAASMLRWKQLHNPAHMRPKYEFDGF